MARKKVTSFDPVTAQVKNIMSKKVQSVRPDTSLDTAVELMMSRDISHLPVTDDEGELVGVLSKTDVVRERFLYAGTYGEKTKFASDGLREEDEARSVGEFMATRVRTVKVTASVAEAAGAMAKFRVHGLPVVDAENALVGFVSTLDVARWVSR